MVPRDRRRTDAATRLRRVPKSTSCPGHSHPYSNIRHQAHRIALDWLTVSPKCNPQELAQSSGQELKLINHPAICSDIGALDEWYRSTKFWDYYIQPLWLLDGTSNLAET